jgi:hypothetical protein
MDDVKLAMTREEAIALLNEQYETCKRIYDCSADQRKSYPNVPQFMEALGMALSALRPVSREQVEKVWKGEWEWYDEEVGSPLEGIEREWGWQCSKCKVVLPDDFDDPDNPPAMRFCQWCGAPMTDEAVQMVMRRLEDLHEEN